MSHGVHTSFHDLDETIYWKNLSQTSAVIVSYEKEIFESHEEKLKLGSDLEEKQAKKLTMIWFDILHSFKS